MPQSHLSSPEQHSSHEHDDAKYKTEFEVHDSAPSKQLRSSSGGAGNGVLSCGRSSPFWWTRRMNLAWQCSTGPDPASIAQQS